jgi:hypothetical protein
MERSNNFRVEAIIEIPRGSRNKYEYDHERGVFRLDRVLYSSVHYPTNGRTAVGMRRWGHTLPASQSLAQGQERPRLPDET